MADNPDPRPGQVTVAIPVNDVPHAPFIFYDGAPVAGYANGVINLTLSATRTYIGPDGAPRTTLSWSHICAALFRQPSVCGRRSTMLCCWPRQRRRERRIKCHIQKTHYREYPRLDEPSLGRTTGEIRI